MDKSEDLSKKYPEYWKLKRKIEDYNNWPQLHTHIQMANSHWQLRLSHWPLMQHSFLTPLAKPNNIEQCEYETKTKQLSNITQFILGIYLQGLKTVE